MLRNLLLNGLLILGSLLFFFLVAEVVCRVFFPDTRIRYQADSEALAALVPNQEGYIFLSDGTRAPKVRINELGVRGAGLDEAADRRVLILGDSFTFGSGVEEDEMFSARVDEALGEDVSVINAGHPGYGIYQIEILFNRIYPEVRPELVVLVIWESLMLRQRYPKQGHQEFIATLDKMNRLKSLSVFGTHLYRMYEQVSLSIGAGKGVIALQATKKSKYSDEVLFERAVRLDSERILRIYDKVKSDGGQLAVVFWPRKGYILNDVEIGMSDWISAQWAAFGERTGIPTYSVQDAFEARPAEALNIPNDGHPTPYAHCLMAQKLMRLLDGLGYPTEYPFECVAPSGAT